TGQTMQLDTVTIPPLATTRLSLRSQLQPNPPKQPAVGRWGDGSRSNSLLGNARLTPISPKDTSARAFSAWTFIKDVEEGLALVTPFKIPADIINTVIEGLWWLPFSHAQAYFALQNTSSVAIEVEMDLLSNGALIARQPVKVAPWGM